MGGIYPLDAESLDRLDRRTTSSRAMCLSLVLFALSSRERADLSPAREQSFNPGIAEKGLISSSTSSPILSWICEMAGQEDRRACHQRVWNPTEGCFSLIWVQSDFLSVWLVVGTVAVYSATEYSLPVWTGLPVVSATSSLYPMANVPGWVTLEPELSSTWRSGSAWGMRPARALSIIFSSLFSNENGTSKS